MKHFLCFIIKQPFTSGADFSPNKRYFQLVFCLKDSCAVLVLQLTDLCGQEITLTLGID